MPPFAKNALMRQPIQLIADQFRAPIAVLVCCLFSSCSLAGAEPPVLPDGTTPSRLATAEQPSLSTSERQTLVAALGAPSFAEREKAATKIMAVGADMLPELQAAAKENRDPEVRLRASHLYGRVATRDFESRAERFLAGHTDDDLLPGWSAVAPVLGDNRPTRELFVEISRAYPELAKAYERAPRERSIAADKAAEAIMNALTVEMRSPLPADAFALLLIAGDADVPVSLPVERALLSMVMKGSVRSVRTEAPLETAYDDLLSRWIRRSRAEHRQELLWLSMQDNLSAGGALALRTLHESTNPTTLQMALQAAARFAEPKDAPLIKHLLDDARPAGDGAAFMGEAGRLETRISDVAMAAIAVIHGKSLQEIGFPHAREHPNVAFQVESLGFSPGDKEARKQVRQRIEKLLAPEQR